MKKVIIKIIGAILTVALLLPVVAVLNTGAMRRYGDVDGDGNVGSVDYLMVKRAVLGSFDLNEIQTVAADVDKSGAVGAVDYLIIKRTVLGSYDLTEYFDDSAVHIHQYVAGETVDPGCETRGYTVYRCYCGAEVHSDFTDPLGHDYYTTGYQESTCTVPGYEDAHCRRCGHDEHTVLPLAQHDFYNVHANLNHVDGNPHFVEYASCRTCGQNNLVKSEVTVYSCVSESGDPLHPDAYGKGGSVSAYLASGALYLTATAGDYYKFLGWSDGCTDRSRLYESASDVCAVFGYDTHVMPVVSIKTETGEQVTHRDYYLNCSITVNNCDDKYAKDNASAKIRVRGNASSNYGDPEYAKTNKVHYRIKFDKKTSFLGVNDDAKCKSWVLLR
ncbi:MAG: dockerin type I repeat-containing protein, partial [Clostridia bacterium]|nr:dockerin type I repeat-containing protein [Clostridia bacterium]